MENEKELTTNTGKLPETEKEAEEEKPKEALKEIPKITMPKDQAKEQWKKYCEVLRKRKEKFLKIMKDAHYHMKEGRELIDIYKIMKETGLNEKNEPKFAIARADIKHVIFEKRDSGTGTFVMNSDWNRRDWKEDIELPQKTFEIHWEREKARDGTQTRYIDKKKIITTVPIIPIEILPDGDLKNYYVMWESKEWEELPATKDPILLKRISENLFVILGSWDLTPLEQSILRGRLE